MKVLNFFTYDYPFRGNDQNFIEDELKMLSTLFDKINVIPIRNKDKFKINYVNKENINYDLSLTNHLFKFKNIIQIIIRIFFCKYLWMELMRVKNKHFFTKVKMIIKERILAENLYLWVIRSKNRNLIKDIFYSYWSNYTVFGFYLLKKKKIINRCFARSLGSDLNGFIPKDTFVPFLNYKFKYLDFILILNDGQKKRLIEEKLIEDQKVIKCYQGIGTQKYYTKPINQKKIHLVSCGRFAKVKNTIEIINLVGTLKEFLTEFKILYSCIGEGPELEIIKKTAKSKLKNIEFNLICKVPNLIDFLKENDVDLYINLSLSEGMSFALMEAMSLSIPVISSSIPGNLEIVNSSNGYIINNCEENEIKKLASAIKNDYENDNFKMKRDKTFKTVSEKINRKVVLENMKSLLKSKFY